MTVVHLDHEESELEPVYQAKKDTPEIKAMGKAFGKTGLARGGRFFAWVLDGASPAGAGRRDRQRAGTGPHDHRRNLRPELSQGRRAHLVGADRARAEAVPPGSDRSLPLSTYSAEGGLRQGPRGAPESSLVTGTNEGGTAVCASSR